MSIASKITLGVAMTISTGIIGYVHYRQTYDQEKLHEGVVQDIQRQQRRKLENTYLLQQQIDLTKQMRNMESDETTETRNSKESEVRS